MRRAAAGTWHTAAVHEQEWPRVWASRKSRRVNGISPGLSWVLLRRGNKRSGRSRMEPTVVVRFVRPLRSSSNRTDRSPVSGFPGRFMARHSAHHHGVPAVRLSDSGHGPYGPWRRFSGQALRYHDDKGEAFVVHAGRGRQGAAVRSIAAQKAEGAGFAAAAGLLQPHHAALVCGEEIALSEVAALKDGAFEGQLPARARLDGVALEKPAGRDQ